MHDFILDGLAVDVISLLGTLMVIDDDLGMAVARQAECFEQWMVLGCVISLPQDLHWCAVMVVMVL